MLRVLQALASIAALAMVTFAMYLQSNIDYPTPDHRELPTFAKVFALYVLITVPAGLLSLLAALIPWKGLPFSNRFWNRAPFVLVTITGMALWFSIWAQEHYRMDRTVERMAVSALGPLPTDESKACALVEEGVYWNAALCIKRFGSKQVQIDAQGTVDKFDIAWPSPCEYQLSKAGEGVLVRVKILHADANGFECAFVHVGKESIVYKARYQRAR
jgi:hypothetical protein